MENELKTGLYGVAAEFESVGEIIEAARRARAAGYTRVEAYSPFPVEELNEAVGGRPTRLPSLIFAAGLAGLLTGLSLQAYLHDVYYPINVGGRPYLSWPSFIPVTFELTILFAAISAVVGMLAANGLPQPYHPVFNDPRFDRASQDRFFLVVEAEDPNFDYNDVRSFLGGLPALGVSDVAY
jgi:hypothetical protein